MTEMTTTRETAAIVAERKRCAEIAQKIRSHEPSQGVVSQDWIAGRNWAALQIEIWIKAGHQPDN